MARQTSDIFVRLNIQEAEGLEKLKSAFRELDKTIGPTSASIDRARQGIIDYAQSSRNTEQVIKGSIEALKSLRGQVERGSDSWAQISNDLLTFEQQARRTDSEIEVLRRGIASSVQGHAQSRSSIEAHIRSLRDLADQATLSGNTLGRVQRDIRQLEQQIEQAADADRTFRRALGQPLAVQPQTILNQWRAYNRVLQDANSSAADLALAQERLNRLAGAPRIQQRRGIAVQAELTSDPEYQRRFGAAGTAYAEGLPNTTAAFSQRLRELQEDLTNTYRGTDAYLALQRELVIVQRDATAATQGLGAALLRDLDTGAAVRSQRNLQEVVATLRNEMLQLDTTTTQGFDQYTRYASDVRNLEEQIARLGRAYNTAATNAQQLSSTTENAVLNRMINEAAMGRIGRQQRARAEGMQELRQAVTAGVQGTPALLLPAAGQTSAPGTGAAISGERVRYGRAVYPSERQGKLKEPQSFRPIGEVFEGTPALYPGNTELQKRITALGDTSFKYRELAKDIRIAQGAGANSINTLETERAAWTRLQAAVDIGSNKYRLAAKRIEELDQRMGRGGPRRLGGRQIAQIGGAAISGGIFGGPEGFLGGVIGGAFGVGGAFAGAAAGAQVGMLRQQLAGTTAYAAEIGKMQIALRGVSRSQANYNQAIQAAARLTNELNIPQREATAGITRLGAAVLGAGGTMNDATYAFRAITESIKATGGNAEQVDGAILALTQVFSKGKVSAEELNQIAERLPGTFTLFAQATGKTGPELQKALEQGTVGLNDLMKFLELASSKNAATALAMSRSSEDAGTRMTIAFQKMALEVGKVLQPIGAQFQDAFANFAKQATPGIIETTKNFGGLLKTIMDNGAAIAAIAKLAIQFGIATYAIKAFTALQGPLTLALQAIAVQFGMLNQQTIAAEAKLLAFGRTAKVVAASLVAPVVLTVAIIGADLVIKVLNDIEAAKSRIEKLKKTQSAAEWLKAAGGTALTKTQLTKLADDVAQEYYAADAVLNKLIKERDVNRGAESLTDYEERMRRARAGLLSKEGNPFGPAFILFAQQYDEATRRVNSLRDRYQAVIKAYPTAPEQRRTTGGSFPTLTPTGTEGDATRATADRQRELQELATAEGDYNLKVFEDGIALDRRRFELRKQLLDEEQQNELARLQGGARTVAQAAISYRNQIAEIDRQALEAAQAVTKEIIKATTAQRVSQLGPTGPGAAGPLEGRYRQGSIGPTSTGPHFDIKQVGGGRFGREALDQYVSVNGRPLSSGTTVPGGMFDAARPGRTRHGGYDYAFSAGATLELKGGAKWVSLGPSGGNGDLATFTTPDGKAYTILHGRFERAAAPTGPQAPTSAARRRDIRQQGRADVTAAGVVAAQQEQQLVEKDVAARKALAREKFSLDITETLRSNNYELAKTLELETERLRLVSSGASQSYIDQQMKLLQSRREQAELEARIRLEFPDFAMQAAEITKVSAAYEEQRNTLEKIYNLNQANANSFGFREGAQRYVESIGTMRDATAQLTESGLKGLEDVLVQLTTTGTANFQEFAASILQQSARMIMQLLIQKTIMQIIGAIGGGGAEITYGGRAFGDIMAGVNKYSANGNVFAANGIVPYAMGGIVNRPTLFPFANGGSIGTGLMGEAGPEAIIPLQRGANGKLGVAGGGGTTNIVVNVDASGGTSVSGDEAQAKQLGQVVTAAVQAELIKQRRPGGLLSR